MPPPRVDRERICLYQTNCNIVVCHKKIPISDNSSYLTDTDRTLDGSVRPEVARGSRDRDNQADEMESDALLLSPLNAKTFCRGDPQTLPFQSDTYSVVHDLEITSISCLGHV